MKHPIKTRIYIYATRIWDYGIPWLSKLMDIIRDWAFNEDIFMKALSITIAFCFLLYKGYSLWWLLLVFFLIVGL